MTYFWLFLGLVALAVVLALTEEDATAEFKALERRAREANEAYRNREQGPR